MAALPTIRQDSLGGYWCVTREASAVVVAVARQPVALGRVHAGKTVTIDVTDTHLVVACDDGPRTIRRTTDPPIRNLKANRPRTVAADV